MMSRRWLVRPGSASAPLPHAKHRLLRQGMPELVCQHCDLTAMVRVVRDQVCGESGYVGAKATDASVFLQSCNHDHAQSVTAALQGMQRLSERHSRAIELRGNLAALGRNL